MKKFITPVANGGLPVYATDITSINQDEIYNVLEGLIRGAGGSTLPANPVIIYGIIVTNYVAGPHPTADISAGLMYINGHFVKYAGATGVDMTGCLVEGPATVTNRTFMLSGTQPAVTESMIAWQATHPTGGLQYLDLQLTQPNIGDLSTGYIQKCYFINFMNRPYTQVFVTYLNDWADNFNGAYGKVSVWQQLRDGFVTLQLNCSPDPSATAPNSDHNGVAICSFPLEFAPFDLGDVCGIGLARNNSTGNVLLEPILLSYQGGHLVPIAGHGSTILTNMAYNSTTGSVGFITCFLHFKLGQSVSLVP